MLTIALLTVKEALRRKIVFAGALMGILFVSLLLLPWAFRSGAGGIIPIEYQVGMISTFGLSMVRFFGAVLGVVMAAGSISAEIERGTLYAIVSKPISRIPILMGKWLGMIILSLVNVTIWSAVVWLAVYNREPGLHLSLIHAALISFIYPVLFISLTLFFSTFAQTPFASALSLIVAGVGWSEGIQRSIGTFANIDILLTGSKIASYVVPMGRISRWILETSSVELPMGFMGQGIVENPPTTSFDIAYVIGYILIVMILATFIFCRRDL